VMWQFFKSHQLRGKVDIAVPAVSAR
jgi:hypothetical protein